MRDHIHKKFMDDINVDFGGGKKPIASQMTDVVMGTGGGGPRGPPPGSAGFVRTAVGNINNKGQRVEFRMGLPRGKRGGPKPGPRPEIPMYERVQPIQPINPLQPPVYKGGSRAYKTKNKPAYKKNIAQQPMARQGRKQSLMAWTCQHPCQHPRQHPHQHPQRQKQKYYNYPQAQR
jgi:hypothetical protein